MNWQRLRPSSLGQWLAVGLLCCGIVYVGLALSPSSYGVVLSQLGIHEGPLLGIARGIRSDEYAVATPFTQAAVRNRFQRFNLTSPYREDLRTFFALPIADWGTLFRPSTVPYFLVPPEYAFSFSFFFLFALFIGGYYQLFREFGIAPAFSLLFCFLLYWTGFVQYWWTDFTPVLAWYPWLYIALVRRQFPVPIHGVVVYYVASCFLLTWFYPPLQLSLIPVTAVLLWTCHRDRFSRIRAAVVACALVGAAVTAAIYMWSDMAVMRHSIYPGQRSYSGGSVPLRFWLGHFFPWIAIEDNRSLLQWNICEVGMVGTLLPISTLVFCDWTGGAWSALRHRSTLIAFAVIFSLISAWMMVPIPSRWAHVIGLDLIGPRRWFFASGFVVFLMSACVFVQVPLRLTVIRFSVSALTRKRRNLNRGQSALFGRRAFCERSASRSR